MAVNFWVFKNPILGICGFLLYCIAISQNLGNKLFQEQKTQNFLYGLLFFLTELIISGTIIYYLYKITPLISFFITLIPVLTLALLPKRETKIEFFKIQSYFLSLRKKQYSFIPLVILLLDTALLLYLFFHRSYELAASPWILIDPIFFFGYALSSILLFYNYKKNLSKIQNIFLTSFHFFVGISVAALLYPLGYGFDAFIHRVTEQWIQNNGFISPKQPYYIGQYSLVVVLSNITQIKIFFIDVFLVPILTSIFLPGIIFSTLQKHFEETKNSFYQYLAFWIIPFVPFLSLHLTTPHNLVLLLGLLLVFLNFSYSKKQISFLLPLLVSLAGVMTHPLIGAPGFLFTLAVFLLKKFEENKKISWSILIFTFLSLCFLLPVLFTLNALRIGKDFPSLGNPFTHISMFLELFKMPYWYAKSSPLRFEILYFCEKMITPTILLLSGWGFFQYKKTQKSPLAFIFPFTGLALFLDAWLLRSWIIFPDVVAYEQGDYPMRLVYTSIIFLLPFAMYGFFHIFQSKLLKKSFILFFILAITLSITLYFSYPQRNIKARFPGYNVTGSDFKAVQWIHEQNSNYNYIVLSNQLVSAAALTEYNFVKYFDTPRGQMFYYSIPTGGELYKYYGKMIYEGQKREDMNQAMDIVGVKKAYFVVNYYWANSNKIIDGAKQSADSYQVIDDGKVWIFEYIKK